MRGLPSRLHSTRSIAWASVTVPTVERALAPMRSWSTTIAGVRFSRDSTSGRGGVAMKPWRKAEYVSLMSRCDSAAIVSNTSELFPEPDTPVNTVSFRFGISRSTPLRLFSRAPVTRIAPQSGPSAWFGEGRLDGRLWGTWASGWLDVRGEATYQRWA